MFLPKKAKKIAATPTPTNAHRPNGLQSNTTVDLFAGPGQSDRHDDDSAPSHHRVKRDNPGRHSSSDRNNDLDSDPGSDPGSGSGNGPSNGPSNGNSR